MRAGDFVMVQLSPSAKRKTLARIAAIVGLSVRIEIYRTNPERVIEALIPMAQIRAAAPESERLVAFRSLYEIKRLRERRESAHVTVHSLANVVGVSPNTIAAAEKGQTKTQPRVRVWILEGLRRVEARAAQV